MKEDYQKLLHTWEKVPCCFCGKWLDEDGNSLPFILFGVGAQAKDSSKKPVKMCSRCGDTDWISTYGR